MTIYQSQYIYRTYVVDSCMCGRVHATSAATGVCYSFLDIHCTIAHASLHNAVAIWIEEIYEMSSSEELKRKLVREQTEYLLPMWACLIS